MSEPEDVKQPPRLSPKEALAKRQAEHLAWKRQFFHSRPPPPSIGRLHRRQSSPIGRSVAASFKRARELAEAATNKLSAQEKTDTASRLGSSGNDVVDMAQLPPRVRRRRDWCERMRQELATRNPVADVQVRSDPRRTVMFFHLHSDTTEADVRLFAEQLGHVESVRLVRRKDTGESRRYAFVEYRYAVDAAKAVQFSGKRRLHGRTVGIDAERGRTQAGFLPQRFVAAGSYDDRIRASDTVVGVAADGTAPETAAQKIHEMSDDEFLNTMLNL